MQFRNIIKGRLSKLASLQGRKRQRVFCLSMQRTGTTSVGKFFRDFGFEWAGWPADKKNDWSESCFTGDYEAIFSSSDFIRANAFEDSPWFYPEFYKILYHRFPSSKFILFIRDPDAWYRSMINHSGGEIIGRPMMHCKVYRRELEYIGLFDQKKLSDEAQMNQEIKKRIKLSGNAEHYKNIYHLYNYEVQEFFKKASPGSLFVCSLEDPEKWIKLGAFLGIQVTDGYMCHENRSDA